MTDEFTADVAGVGALAEPARRALYRYVAGQQEPVSREEAAEGCSLPVHSAKFHLDRLVEVGLLDVEYRRLSGRSGPGAGRPAKLYRRSGREVSVSLPARRYDVAGEVLADAIDRSLRETLPLAEAVRAAAEKRGREMAASAPPAPSDTGGATEHHVDRVAGVLAAHGYEPRTSDTRIDLANCPFHALAREHTELVCGMNVSLVSGVLDELGCHRLEAVLAPEPGLCCVKALPRS